MKILILAGGTGTRLWPVSRKRDPKQVQPFLGSQTLLKSTVNRMLHTFKKEDLFLSTNQSQLKLIKKDLGSLILKNHYLVEPEKRDTAAAIGFAVMSIAQKNPDATIATVWADHHLNNSSEYSRILRQAEKTVNKYPDHLVLIGLKPAYPETGYGYIKLNKIFDTLGKDKIYKVGGFKEKPDLKTAAKYLTSGHYLWNPGYFVFKPQTMLDLFKKYLPKHYGVLMEIKNQPGQIKKYFGRMEKISIDYGIMERAKKMLCLPASFDWVDVGHWRTIHDVLAKKPADNVLSGNNIVLDSSGNLIYNFSNKLVTAVGLRNMIVVQTDDALLVCPKDRAQDVKKIVEELERRQLKKYL
ncbi:MAG: sugar phosphate nucleotidyltransferase [Candidatus Komeilibacteria bacterium]|nr:sugar phosphate nucleotidyltransferase [Candidatus Komeilibacteria bacterium]